MAPAMIPNPATAKAARGYAFTNAASLVPEVDAAGETEPVAVRTAVEEKGCHRRIRSVKSSPVTFCYQIYRVRTRDTRQRRARRIRGPRRRRSEEFARGDREWLRGSVNLARIGRVDKVEEVAFGVGELREKDREALEIGVYYVTTSRTL